NQAESLVCGGSGRLRGSELPFDGCSVESRASRGRCLGPGVRPDGGPRSPALGRTSVHLSSSAGHEALHRTSRPGRCVVALDSGASGCRWSTVGLGDWLTAKTSGILHLRGAVSRYRDESPPGGVFRRSEEHTSELQSRENLVCRLRL